MRNILCQGLVGYCYFCKNFAVWDEKLQKMRCFAYFDGIPASMWERVEAGKQCLYRNKDRIRSQEQEIRKQIDKIASLKLPDEDAIRAYNKMKSLILDRENVIDKTIRMRVKEFEKWPEKIARQD